MTTVTFELDDNNLFKGFECNGHAGYSKKFGTDIVCSAISTLTINFVNTVDELLNKEVIVEANEKTGYMKVSVTDYSDEKVQLLFKSLELGLKGIQEDYSKYIKLTNRR